MTKGPRVTRQCGFCGKPFETTPKLIAIGKGTFCSRPCAYKQQAAESGSPERLAQRFFAHVNLNGPTPPHRPELGPCHVWTGILDDHGYGKLGVCRRDVKAHRLAFFLAEGRWPEPCALHLCDNRPCVRRSHLTEGTKKENTADMFAKGRARPGHVFGETHGGAKLTEADVIEIRAARGRGESRRAVAERYGLSRNHVSQITTGTAWSHL